MRRVSPTSAKCIPALSTHPASRSLPYAGHTPATPEGLRGAEMIRDPNLHLSHTKSTPFRVETQSLFVE